MNDIQLFKFENDDLRTLVINDEPYFVGNDVATALGYSNYRKAIFEHVDEEDKLRTQIRYAGQNRQMTVINESGLYSLILSSKLPSAKKFKRWVTSEVLPSLRKHDAYLSDKKIEEVLTDPDTIIELATQLKNEREGRLICEQQVNELKPKAAYYDKILVNPSLISITVIAKDYGMSGIEMNNKLFSLGVQYKRGGIWLLYADYQNLGWTQSETYMVKHANGTEKSVVNTKWTKKGRLGIYELLNQNGILTKI